MKKRLIFFLFLICGFSLLFLISANEKAGSDNANNQNSNESDLLGSSCATVSPEHQDECCKRKGYKGWDSENFECIGERIRERERNIEHLNSGIPKEYGNLTTEQIREKNMIRIKNHNQSECPEKCICFGETIKCEFENGSRIMTVLAGNSGNMIVQVKNANMSTNVTLYKINEKIYGIFKNNETKEIILPDEIREKIHERFQEREKNKTRIILTEENLTLNENGEYHFQAKKRAKLFWIIPVKEKIQSQINSETGEIIKEKRSWWGFLAKDIKSKN